jgi:hypothetical protein
MTIIILYDISNKGAMTSGESCLLEYHKHLFSLGEPIQPFAMRVWGPFD